DVVIIGGGHNGLTCAAYLGMAGLKVKVLERRAVIGGAAVTEKFHPGLRKLVAAYTVNLLNPKVISDPRPHDHGLNVFAPPAHNLHPDATGPVLLVAHGQTERNIGKFSSHDAERQGAFNRDIDMAANVLRDLILRAPPNLGLRSGPSNIGELIRAGMLGNKLRRLSTDDLRTPFDLFTKSAGD